MRMDPATEVNPISAQLKHTYYNTAMILPPIRLIFGTPVPHHNHKVVSNGAPRRKTACTDDKGLKKLCHLSAIQKTHTCRISL